MKRSYDRKSVWILIVGLTFTGAFAHAEIGANEVPPAGYVDNGRLVMVPQSAIAAMTKEQVDDLGRKIKATAASLSDGSAARYLRVNFSVLGDVIALRIPADAPMPSSIESPDPSQQASDVGRVAASNNQLDARRRALRTVIEADYSNSSSPVTNVVWCTVCYNYGRWPGDRVCYQQNMPHGYCD